jgi:hypothetical protein
MIEDNLFLLCNCCEKKTPPLDETGGQGDLRLRKMHHRHRARTSHWRSRHRDEAVVWGNAAATWASPYPGVAKKANLFMVSGYSQDGYLMAKMTLSSDVVGDGGEHHAISQDFSQHWQGGDGQRPKGTWTSPARDQGEA